MLLVTDDDVVRPDVPSPVRRLVCFCLASIEEAPVSPIADGADENRFVELADVALKLLNKPPPPFPTWARLISESCQSAP